MEQLVTLEEIKFLKEELDVDSGENSKAMNEHHIDETSLKKIWRTRKF